MSHRPDSAVVSTELIKHRGMRRSIESQGAVAERSGWSVNWKVATVSVCSPG